MEVSKGINGTSGAQDHIPAISAPAAIGRALGVVAGAVETDEPIPTFSGRDVDDRFVEPHAATFPPRGE